MVTIDGQKFKVPIIKLSRSADVLDKYSNRTENGDLQREIIGVYFNYKVDFAFPNREPNEYRRLWNKLTEPKEFHKITLYDENGPYTFIGYITGVKDEIIYVDIEKRYVKTDGISCNMIAKSPSRK